MAPTPTKNPTRSSDRIKDLIKKKAAEPQALATVNLPKKRKAARAAKRVPNKIAKPIKKSRTTKFRYFLTPEQLSDIVESHEATKWPHQWEHGDFAFAAAGEAIPAGSLEMTIKVPTGFNFLVFPPVLKVEEGVGEEEMEVEEEEEEEEESSDSDLSECGYVSDVHV